MPLIVFKEFFVQERRMDLVIKHQENKRSGVTAGLGREKYSVELINIILFIPK